MSKGSFSIAGNTILPGCKQTILFPAPNLNMQVSIDIPVHVFNGVKPGPRLFITAAMHGDELNGIEILRRIHEYIRLKDLCGTIVTVPVVNIYGVMIQSRYFADRRDLNRAFPGAKKGTLAARLAHGVMQHLVANCDYGIDLHTGGITHLNMPQLRVDFTVPGTKQFAKYFNAPIILDSKQRDGSLRQAAGDKGVPVIVYEGGEALRYNELCIRGGVRGIKSVLHHLGMMHSKEKIISQKSKSVITNTSRWVRAPASGMVEPVADVIAKHVNKGDLLAHVHDPFLINPSVDIVSPFEGIVIGQALKAMATEGDALFHIASFNRISGVRAYIDEYREDIAND